MIEDLIDVGTNVKDLLGAGAALGEVSQEGNLLYAIVPEGYELKIEDMAPLLEQSAAAPSRCTSRQKLRTTESFCEYVRRSRVDGTTVCFADLDKAQFEAVFNYDGAAGAPGWCDHTAVLDLQYTKNWSRWIAASGKRMGQLALADFFDANMDDIVEPDAASIVETITALKIKRKAEFHSAVDSNTGFTTVNYTENVSGEAVKGSLEFFGRFVIGVAPFRGSDPYKVRCVLRFSIEGENNLSVYFTMINQDIVEEAAFDVEREKVLSVMDEIEVPVFDV